MKSARTEPCNKCENSFKKLLDDNKEKVIGNFMLKIDEAKKEQEVTSARIKVFTDRINNLKDQQHEMKQTFLAFKKKRDEIAKENATLERGLASHSI